MSRNLAIVIVAIVAAGLVGFYFLGMVDADDRAEYAPEGHFVTMNATEAGPERAESIYESLRTDMAERYGRADEPNAGVYQTWKRFNTAPYRSATHGQRFVNNFGNQLADDYKAVEKGTKMPVGAILAKDSFAITKDGDVYAQSLFLMEKLAPGTSKATGDWRYVMITPTGESYGDTMGANPEKMDFCHDCHRAVQRSDYLFYIPEAYRIAE